MIDLKKMSVEMRDLHEVTPSMAESWANQIDAHIKAHADPVAVVIDCVTREVEPGKWDWSHGEFSLCKPQRLNIGTKLYAAPPLPSVSREKLHAAVSAEIELTEKNGSAYYTASDRRIVENALRALGITVTGGQS